MVAAYYGKADVLQELLRAGARTHLLASSASHRAEALLNRRFLRQQDGLGLGEGDGPS
jgi:hypothetical protein